MFWQGEFQEARRRLETALTLYDPGKQRTETLDTQVDLQANATLHLGWTLWFLGYADQAIAKADEAIRMARRLGQPLALAMALFWAGATRVCCGDHVAAEALCKELRAVATRYHIAYLGAAGMLLETHSIFAKGKLDAGVTQVRRGLEEFRRQRAGLGWTFAISFPAAAFAQTGDANEGLALLADAFDMVHTRGDRFWEAELHRLKGDLLLVRSPADEDEAEQCYRRAADIAARQGARFLELRAVTSLTRLHLTRGNRDTVGRLEALYASFQEGRQVADLQQARAVLDAEPFRTV
jgi:predicted ATPase